MTPARGSSKPWSTSERALIDEVEPALSKALQLKAWWERTEGRETQRFQLVRAFERPDVGYSYFARPPLNGKTYPVMGDLQNLFYDQPKSEGSKQVSAEWMCAQIREFTLRYFLRVLQSRSPEAFPNTSREMPGWLRPLSWCPQKNTSLHGFGYRQLYYKLRSDGSVRRFPASEQKRIIDLRELVDTYEWIVVVIRIFDFDLAFRPLGPNLPSIDIPLREQQYAVISRDLLVDADRPRPGLLGEYGIGYALIPNPDPDHVLAYGPGSFEAGFQLMHFQVLTSGEVRVILHFMVNRPQRLLNISQNPLKWGLEVASLVPGMSASRAMAPMHALLDSLPGRNFSISPLFSSIALLNLVTGGLAGRKLCISKEQLEKDMLVKHFQQTFETIETTLFIWRLVPDWLDREALPAWARTGSLFPSQMAAAR